MLGYLINVLMVDFGRGRDLKSVLEAQERKEIKRVIIITEDV